jgi:hypothetical protein
MQIKVMAAIVGAAYLAASVTAQSISTSHHIASARNISFPPLGRENSSLKSSRSSSRSMCRRISPILSDLLPSLVRTPGAYMDTLWIVLFRKPDLEASALPVYAC